MSFVHFPICKHDILRLTKIHLQRDILNLLECSGKKDSNWNIFSSKADKLELVSNRDYFDPPCGVDTAVVTLRW